MNTATQPVLARSIRTTNEGLIVEFDGHVMLVPWAECSLKLATAGAEQRAVAELSPSGYGVHWPLLDEDLAIGPLVAGRG